MTGPAVAKATERAALLDRYAAGSTAVESAAAAARGHLDAVPRDGGWTPRMVLHHLADSETRSAVRLRQLLAEDTPTIHGYDEAHYASVLHYDRPVEVSLRLVLAVREANLELLHLLGEDDLGRTGTHTESGAYSVLTWLETYSAHAHDHAEQIRGAL